MSTGANDCVAPELLRSGLSRDVCERPVVISHVEPDMPPIGGSATRRSGSCYFEEKASESGRRGAQMAHGKAPNTEKARCMTCGAIFTRSRIGRPTTTCQDCRHEKQKEHERNYARRKRKEAKDGR